MALPIQVESLLEGTIVESARLECKADWNPEAVLRTVCAFANDIDNWGGGYLLIGVAEQNGILQVSDGGLSQSSVDRIMKELLNTTKRIEPSYAPIAEPKEIRGGRVLVIWAPGGSNRPYRCPASLAKEEKRKAYYIRRMASTVQATIEEERDLFALANQVPFDDRIHHGATLADLKLALIQSFLQDIRSDLLGMSGDMDFKDLCTRMRIADGPSEDLRPLNVGLLFFNDHPQRIFRYSRIEMAEFGDDPTGSRMTEKIFEGPLDHMLRDSLNYLKNMVIKERVIKVPGKPESERCFNYPFEAIEEAMANAVYHRSYELREPIEVRIFDDRIEILSYPGPDRSVSLEALRTFRVIARRYRNRRIGEFLKELRLTEGKGTGIPRILQSLRSNGSPDPAFETDEDRSYFLTTLRIHPFFHSDGSSAPESAEIEMRILNAIGREGVTRKQLAEKLGYRSRPASLTDAIDRMLLEGRLRLKYPSVSKHPGQRLLRQ
jgi:ATP-dependent DNA helicase RecG